MYNHIKTLIIPQNVATYYHQSKIFRLNNLSKEAKAYIHCWFTTVAETKNFLELGIESVEKILSSSNLYISSEIEVFTAANAWIGYKFNERKKFSKDLLETVRLSLLSINALNYCLQLDSSFKIVEECQEVIKKALNKKEICFTKKQSNKNTIEVGTRSGFPKLFCKIVPFLET